MPAEGGTGCAGSRSMVTTTPVGHAETGSGTAEPRCRRRLHGPRATTAGRWWSVAGRHQGSDVLTGHHLGRQRGVPVVGPPRDLAVADHEGAHDRHALHAAG